MSQDKDLFLDIKNSLLKLDPVAFIEKYLMLDGKPFRLNGNGYKPFVDIYRYVGVKALERDAKPMILVKSRQVGGTTMASALEMFFMGSGLFGSGNNPPIRVIHAFPQLEHAAAYSKTKLNPMITESISVDNGDKKAKHKSYMQSLLDSSSDTNNSLHFKQFAGGNHIWIESTGLNADRLRGRTGDVIFFDECFPYHQCILTENGKIKIGKLYKMFTNNEPLPQVLTFNEEKEIFEYKNIVNAWKREKRKIFELQCENRKIECTGNHRFLTTKGWKKVEDMLPGDVIKTSNPELCQISYAPNDDQYQIILGSFLGDGCIQKIGKNKHRLSITHGIKQEEYCRWKVSMFGSNVSLIKENGYSKKPAISFRTKTFCIEKEFVNKKQSCPQWVLDDLDARGLAIWFMDDGATNKKIGAVIHTCSFDEDSQIRMVAKLQSMGIDCEYRFYKRKNKLKEGYYSIFMNKKGYNKLCELISPYIHDNIAYKINKESNIKYNWNKEYKKFGLITVKSILETNKEKEVYDLEIKDNHNFIVSSGRLAKGDGGLIAHNCQDISGMAISNATKMLTTAKYGRVGDGVQVYFGTPKRKGSDYYKMWMASSQQYFYLGCEKCKQYFPLYTPESDDWEKIWLHGFIVKCTHCDHEQDKRPAAERGKWIASKKPDEYSIVGFHINQLYMPDFTKEKIMSEKPGIHPIATERSYRNEVLGEFYQGDSSPITPEEIRELCGDPERKMRASIPAEEDLIVTLGIDYGLKSDLEQLADNTKSTQGQSFSTAVILVSKGPQLLSIEFCTKFKRNDEESKRGLIDQLMRQYSVKLAIGDIGFSQEFSEKLHTAYGDRYLVSRAHNTVNGHIKYNKEIFPKEIVFQKNFYYAELIEQMRGGKIRFPLGDYEKTAWLIQHCSNNEIKPSISRGGDPTIHYVKSGPNDGFAALLNAYIAYKFIITNGLSNNNPLINQNAGPSKPLIVVGHISRKF